MGKPRQHASNPLPFWAKEICALRTRQRLNQIEFGRRLKASPMAVSRWERGLSVPPLRCLIAMGKIAGPPIGWTFWNEAGITEEDVYRMLQYPGSTYRRGRDRESSTQRQSRASKARSHTVHTHGRQ